jgi:hypothetical protein
VDPFTWTDASEKEFSDLINKGIIPSWVRALDSREIDPTNSPGVVKQRSRGGSGESECADRTRYPKHKAFAGSSSGGIIEECNKRELVQKDGDGRTDNG